MSVPGGRARLGRGGGFETWRVVGGHAVLVVQEKEEEVFDRNIPAPKAVFELDPLEHTGRSQSTVSDRLP